MVGDGDHLDDADHGVVDVAPGDDHIRPDLGGLGPGEITDIF